MVCEYDAHPHRGPCPMWAGKPGLTCPNGIEHGFVSDSIGSTETSVPGAASTAREPANPDRRG
jgi:hypothetical protein